MANDNLSTYLNDHLAGSVGALEMIAYLREKQAERLDVEVLGRVESEIKDDHDLLERLMSRLGVSHSVVRRTAGWLSERAARLKLAVDDPHDGDLRVFEMLELISLGIEGKISLWKALSAAGVPDGTTNYDRLIDRARGQRLIVEAMHLNAARTALH
ncbi:MAG TPA: hypothetical protein VIP11_13560 [Gemmatimonadaceae bacterium]